MLVRQILPSNNTLLGDHSGEAFGHRLHLFAFWKGHPGARVSALLNIAVMVKNCVVTTTPTANQQVSAYLKHRTPTGRENCGFEPPDSDFNACCSCFRAAESAERSDG